MSAFTKKDSEYREKLLHIVEHLHHVLPGQAPIQDFVHHNTLHGYQQMSFPEALKHAHRTTGAYGYLPEKKFHELHAQGRITDEDLLQVINNDRDLYADEQISPIEGSEISRKDIYLTALLHPIKAVTSCQLTWKIEELNSLYTFQSDISDDSRHKLLKRARANGKTSESEAINDLWHACLTALDLEHFLMHPEDMLDLSPEQAEKMLSEILEQEDKGTDAPLMDSLIGEEADTIGRALFESNITIASLLRQLTGNDLLADLRPVLIRYLAPYLDQGQAAWTSPDRDQGFYVSWRKSAATDLAWMFDDMPDWFDSIHALPEDAVDTVMIELRWLGLPEDNWGPYLEELALELPGWSGMFCWRHNHKNYNGQTQPVDMMDYLAVRLIMERLFAQRLCRTNWQIEASFDVIRWYFRHHRIEFWVRYIFHNTRLPEYLTTQVQRLLNCSELCSVDDQQWNSLAHLVWTWRKSPAAGDPEVHSVYRSAWRLFRLSQHMGVDGNIIRKLNTAQIESIFECLDRLDQETSGFIWLRAYEHHYRERMLTTLASNSGRGRWQSRDRRPQAQIIFCMDDREEAFRRHLEEHNPEIETLGAAGFFGVAINWLGLDERTPSSLCPVVVTPSHNVMEVPRQDQLDINNRHVHRRSSRIKLRELLHSGTTRDLIRSVAVILVSAPGALVVLTARLLAPLSLGRLLLRLRNTCDLTVKTDITINAQDPSVQATEENPRKGFTDAEQADRVDGFLRNTGLVNEFSRLVILMGHGSSSQNNPHMAAYDCGACSGRHGGPNARVFAAMANRPEIRRRLSERGINIAADTWFIGAEHDTCDESISWYDLDLLTDELKPDLLAVQQDLDIACRRSARERCRRLASAPKDPGEEEALTHIISRSLDFSQARPELGHVTNAAAFIGRRAMSQGTFFDRRVFLISYDPTIDADGCIIEKILLNVGPVGAGISLEYYFSTVNNDLYGSGSKVTHNVTGLFGVMDGTSSDLRTGLPLQMIEIHEAMRLQVVVEASTDVLTKIYQRQPDLQELIGNGWILLSVMDPNSGEISVFDPDSGFIAWENEAGQIDTIDNSHEWYRGHDGPLPPVLIRQPGVSSHG